MLLRRAGMAIADRMMRWPQESAQWQARHASEMICAGMQQQRGSLLRGSASLIEAPKEAVRWSSKNGLRPVKP